VIASPRSSSRRGDRSPNRRIYNQEKRKPGNEHVTRSTQGHELGLGPLSTRIKRMERIWPQNLASVRVFRGQRKFSVTGAAPRPHTKDTKVPEATSLCFADAFFLGNFSSAFETRSSPDSLGATHRAFTFYLGNPFPAFLLSLLNIPGFLVRRPGNGRLSFCCRW
jgi:hypothetical protein